MTTIPTERLARRRRPFDELEARVVRLFLAADDPELLPIYWRLRYALSFARLTAVRRDSDDGADVDVDGLLQLHAWDIRDLLSEPLAQERSLWKVARLVPDVVQKTRQARASLLEHLPIPREDLEAEVTTRLLAVANGGGGGAGYVYPGAYRVLEAHGLAPSLMVGTSIGALLAMFRCRRARYDFAPFVAGARALSWAKVFRVFQTESRYGLPATLKLYLRDVLGSLFVHEEEGRPLQLQDMGIPLFVVATGITVDALKHDLGYYEHLLDDNVQRLGMRDSVRGGIKALSVLREFLGNRDALVEVVLGREPGTEGFDVLDAAGFSAAIPGIIHYDVLRDDPRMKGILDTLYARHGITRLGEGGMVSNVPARIAWETVASGTYGRRNVFVLALDCLAPNPRRFTWYPLSQAVRTANVEADLRYTDLYIDFPRTLSPMNLVPPLKQTMQAIEWGEAAMEAEMPFVDEMMRPIPVLKD